MPTKPKVLVIGLDGATLNLIEPWAQAGHLPVMQRLMNTGAFGKLQSVMPVLSSAAWSSFMTGKNPGMHGMYDFVRREADGYRLRVMRRENIHSESLWKILSRNDQRVGVINVPMTYPAEEVNGFLVTGLGTPEFKPFTYPESLGKELGERGYRVNKTETYRPDNEQAYLKELHAMTARQHENALWLMKEKPWDFFMNVFFGTDQVAHFFWRHMDPNHPAHDPEVDPVHANAIRDFYQKVDGYIGELIEAAGPETSVFILSDHGAGPLYQDVFLNEWLRQSGYLTVLNSGSNQTAQLGGSHRVLARLGLTRSGVSAFLRRNRLGRVERWIKDALGDRIELLPRTQRADFPEAIDWEQTTAYSFGYQGQVYLNLKGREPQGIVPVEKYQQVCDEIAEKLLAISDPRDGRRVVDRVLRRDDVFHGPYTDYAPDLILVMRGLAYNTRQGYEFSARGGTVFTDPITFESGCHRYEGVLIANGPGIQPAGRLEGARLVDLTPTILHLMNCPVPDDMDGRVLSDWITTRRPVEVEEGGSGKQNGAEEATFSDEEEKEMIDRLKSLGYLE
ncbi:MAG: alkaline phosphatase family protein [Anaerolineales bacterium]|jgi:predicted AlkP superfamily phosphohydrolase/phosphomutase